MATYNDAGKYRVKIIGACLVKAESSGNDQMLLSLQIEGKYQEGYGLVDYPPPTYPPEVYLPLTEATMHGRDGKPGWVAELLRYLGFDGDFDNLHLLREQYHDALCKHEESISGSGLVEKWSILKPGGVRQVATPEKKEVRRLNTQWGNLFTKRSTPAQAPTTPTPAPAPRQDPPRRRPAEPQPATSNGGTDDIPF